jgi:hypothetical protein
MRLCGVPDNIKFASERQEKEWASPTLNPLLRRIVTKYASIAASLGWNWTITSVWRSRAEDAELEGTGIHCESRAADIRTKDAPPGAQADVVAQINNEWEYDPARPNLLVAYDKPHGDGPHLHLQVHYRTRLRIAGKLTPPQEAGING